MSLRIICFCVSKCSELFLERSFPEHPLYAHGLNGLKYYVLNRFAAYAPEIEGKRALWYKNKYSKTFH